MAKKRPLNPSLVKVQWLDAFVTTEQLSQKEAIEEVKLAVRWTTGYFVHEDPDDDPHGRLILAQDYDPPDGFATVTAIPKGWITRRKVVEGKKPSGFGRKPVRRTMKGKE